VSRKRKKAQKVEAPVDAEVEAAVAEEILAEGSGPIVSDEVLAEAAAAAAETEAHAEPILPAPDDADPIGDSIEALEAAAHAALDDRDPTDAELDAIEAEGSASDTVEAAADSDGELEGESPEGATLPVAAAGMDAAELKQLVEALVFASDKPVTVQRLRQLTRVADTKRLEATLVELQGDYADRGLILTSVSGGWQFRTQPRFSTWVQQLIAGRPVRLSRAQLETLAIVAYRQPITRPEIDDIRGVDSSATLKLLLDRQLIRVLGKKEEVGRPMLYGTTKEFLDFFSLGDLRELPTLREYSELSDESRRVMSDRLGIDPDSVDARGDNIAPAAQVEHTSPLDSGAIDGSDIIEASEAALEANEDAVEATDAAVDAVAAAVDAVADAVDAVEDAADAVAHDAADASEHIEAAAADDVATDSAVDDAIEAVAAVDDADASDDDVVAAVDASDADVVAAVSASDAVVDADAVSASDADVDADAVSTSDAVDASADGSDADVVAASDAVSASASDVASESDADAVSASDADVVAASDAVSASASDVASESDADADADADAVSASNADSVAASDADVSAPDADADSVSASDAASGAVSVSDAETVSASDADPDAELEAPTANTLSGLAERILAEDAAREPKPRIDVDAMPGVRADSDDADVLASKIEMTDEIIDSDDADASDSE
jgi:segregation and condensation protein B